MPGSSFVNDVLPVASVNSQIVNASPAQIAALFPLTITPTALFSFPWNGSILQFNIGDTQPVAPDLLAALTAAGASFTSP